MAEGDNVAFTVWADKAACKGMVHIFYSDFSERPVTKRRREEAAKAICKNCPVIQNCKQHAHANAEYGIWGGENEDERFAQNVPIPQASRADYLRRKRKEKKDTLSGKKKKEILNV